MCLIRSPLCSILILPGFLLLGEVGNPIVPDCSHLKQFLYSSPAFTRVDILVTFYTVAVGVKARFFYKFSKNL